MLAAVLSLEATSRSDLEKEYGTSGIAVFVRSGSAGGSADWAKYLCHSG